MHSTRLGNENSYWTGGMHGFKNLAGSLATGQRTSTQVVNRCPFARDHEHLARFTPQWPVPHAVERRFDDQTGRGHQFGEARGRVQADVVFALAAAALTR